MAGGKETPRQKMIGMMYLVLTALLALNISKEVLNGFVKVERGLIQTQETLKEKSLQSFSEIESRMIVNQTKVAPFHEQAVQVKEASETLRAHMQELKARTMAYSQGAYDAAESNGMKPYLDLDDEGYPMCVALDAKDEEGEDLIKQKDEYTNVTRFLYGENIAEPKDGEWSARDLRNKLEAYRDMLKSISFSDANGNRIELPNGLQLSIDERFQFPNEIESDKEVTWEFANFHDNPLAAVMPIMSKLIIDVQDAEHDVLSFLLSGIDGKSFKVNKFVPLVVPESNYVLRGDSIRAKVMLAAFDNTNIPDMYLSEEPWDGDSTAIFDFNGTPTLPVDRGTGFGTFQASTRSLSLGEHQFKGLVRFRDTDGSYKDYQVLTDPITVAEPALVVSPSKMNVFYRGLPNPVEISVPGVPQDKIEVRIDGGHKLVRQSDGTYVVEANANTQVKEANITVTAELPDGSKKSLPAKNFRVKRIPDPVVNWLGNNSVKGTIKMSEVQAFAPLNAAMENFDFEFRARVKKFTLLIVRSGQVSELTSNSNQFTSDMKDALGRLRAGDNIYFTNILVTMPDGDRPVAPLTLKIIN
ncbi:MAG: GldM family protein [Bacteroidetes bacterium]|nr:GldM family protein [Bacteroidota bacterium]MDA0903326.1 GldM family protein [Bacteroidota bacterium]MDA1242292.1 GldM family protein [Bacteroidota bacterium]